MKPTKYWKPTPEVYAQIQKLKEFVHQVANHELATEQDKQNALKVISRIETIDQPETYDKDWFVDLAIHDNSIRENPDEVYVTTRHWWLYFEHNNLYVEIETWSNSYQHVGHYGEDFEYSAVFCLWLRESEPQVYFYEDIDYFIQDATNYKNYITEALNDVEVEISFG